MSNPVKLKISKKEYEELREFVFFLKGKGLSFASIAEGANLSAPTIYELSRGKGGRYKTTKDKIKNNYPEQWSEFRGKDPEPAPKITPELVHKLMEETKLLIRVVGVLKLQIKDPHNPKLQSEVERIEAKLNQLWSTGEKTE